MSNLVMTTILAFFSHELMHERIAIHCILFHLSFLEFMLKL